MSHLNKKTRPINVDDILFDRLRKEDYIRCRNRGMTEQQIADCYGKSLINVQRSALRWNLRPAKFERKKVKRGENQ